MRKPRQQSRLSKLSPEQREKLHGWLRENLTLVRVSALAKSEFDVTVSRTAVSDYYRKWSQDLIAVQAATNAALVVGGVEIVITCETPGKIKVAIKALPATDETAAKPGGAKR